MGVNMKKNIAIALCLLMTAGMLAGCSKPAQKAVEDTTSESVKEEKSGEIVAENDEKADKESSQERTTFTVGFDAEFPPYGYMDDNGEYVGFDLDLAAEVCARNGWELVKQPIEWATKDMELSSGSIDCIWNGFTMNGRLDKYTWSSPYVDNSQVFVVSKESGIASLEDLAQKAVGVQKDSSALAALNDEEVPENIALRDSFGSLTEYADYNIAFMDLEAGAVDAIAMDIGVANYQISSRNENGSSDEFIILDKYLATEQYGIGFYLGNEELRDQVEATLQEMSKDGKFLEIAQKWGLESSVLLGK